MKYGNGSKLLLGLLIQGGIVGAAVLYNKFRKELNEENADLDSIIEKAEQQDRETSAEKPSENKNQEGSSITDDLLSEIDNFTNKAKEVVKEMEKPVNILEDFLSVFKVSESPAKKDTAPTDKKAEASKTATTDKKPEVNPENVKTNQQSTSASPAPTAKKPEAPRTKTVQEINDELFSQINTYKKPDSEADVVEKTKVNLTKPEVVKPVQKNLNNRIKKAISDKTNLSSEDVGKRVREKLTKVAAEKKVPQPANKPSNAKKPVAKKAPVKKTDDKSKE